MTNTIALLLAAFAVPPVASVEAGSTAQTPPTDARNAELIALSRQKWVWMAEKNVDALSKLFHENSIFVHMSRTMTQPQELEVIRSGDIEYRRADIHEISVQFIGDTAVVASRIDLHAVVGGNVAANPFSVTETYVKVGSQWKLAALAFSRRSVPN